jgi:hypothetical protein
VGDELVRSPEKDLAWHVLSSLSTKRTLDGDRLKGKLPDAGWNVAAASLAGDDERFAA